MQQTMIYLCSDILLLLLWFAVAISAWDGRLRTSNTFSSVYTDSARNNSILKKNVVTDRRCPVKVHVNVIKSCVILFYIHLLCHVSCL